MTAHIMPVRTNLVIFGLLILLTITTVAVDFVDLGSWNLVAAISIAVTKAVLVALYFMHLRYSGHLVVLFMIAAVAWLLILIGLTIGDVMSRQWLDVPQAWQ